MWDVVVSRELRPLVDSLKGKATGYSAAYRQLEQNPCAEFASDADTARSFAYRLSGPLASTVCGVRLKRGYRLAFTLRPPEASDFDGIVIILYVGLRDTRDRSRDIWTIVHDLFGVSNPPSGHLRPPCCGDGLAEIDDHEMAQFMTRLQTILRRPRRSDNPVRTIR